MILGLNPVKIPVALVASCVPPELNTYVTMAPGGIEGLTVTVTEALIQSVTVARVY